MVCMIFFASNKLKFCCEFYLDFCESLSISYACNPTQKYRSIDGRCNNLERPFVGAANTPLKRLLKPNYKDLLSSPPKSVTGNALPSTRLISLTVFPSAKSPNLVFTQAFSQMAQIIAHDISNVPKAPTARGCCRENGQLVLRPDKSCMYIPVPPNDQIHTGKKCMDFVRSLTDRDLSCSRQTNSAPAQQMNKATASLDLSSIYGTSLEQLRSLRSFYNGQLKVTTKYNDTWPYQIHPKQNVCFVRKITETCFHGGDSRMNQNSQLTIVHILFLREHNRIAKELKKVNPHWSEEILFQEARRLNIAQYQNIFYYGWFAYVAGEQNLKRLGFFFQNSGGAYANDYNSSVDISIYNEWSAGMFRIPHTIIEGQIR